MTKIIAILFSISLSIVSTKASAAVQFRSSVSQLYSKVGEGFSVDLSTLLQDAGSGTLTWSVDASLPAWLQLDRSQLKGTPQRADAGTAHFRVFVNDGSIGATTEISLHVNEAITTTTNQINLGIQQVGQNFYFDLKTVLNVENAEALTFTSRTLPSWLVLNSLGNLNGTPTLNDVGAYSFTVTVTDPQGAAKPLTVVGSVQEIDGLIESPSWTAPVLTTDDVYVNHPFAIDLNKAIVNPAHYPVTVTVSGGNWVTLGANGLLTGNPGLLNVGKQRINLELSTTVNGVVYSAKSVLAFQVRL